MKACCPNASSTKYLQKKICFCCSAICTQIAYLDYVHLHYAMYCLSPFKITRIQNQPESHTTKEKRTSGALQMCWFHLYNVKPCEIYVSAVFFPSIMIDSSLPHCLVTWWSLSHRQDDTEGARQQHNEWKSVPPGIWGDALSWLQQDF